jgi:hypothetical protein
MMRGKKPLILKDQGYRSTLARESADTSLCGLGAIDLLVAWPKPTAPTPDIA